MIVNTLKRINLSASGSYLLRRLIMPGGRPNRRADLCHAFLGAADRPPVSEPLTLLAQCHVWPSSQSGRTCVQRVGSSLPDPCQVAAIVDRVTFNVCILETGTQPYRLRTTKTASHTKNPS